MPKKTSGTEHFEVSFVDADGNRRIALAHSEEQAKAMKEGFEVEREARLVHEPLFRGLEDVQVHKVSTSRENLSQG